MFLFERLAEERIKEAMEEGEFDAIEGQGRPLELEDDSMVPDELRTAYRMLKNSGHLPPELSANQEIRQLEDLLDVVDDPETERRARERLRILVDRLQLGRGRASSLKAEQAYKDKLLRRFADDAADE